MSTEFDSTGFSAVSSFFGSKDDPIDEEVNQSSTKKRNKSGLGSFTKKNDVSRIENLKNDETREKIMSIGKKRKHLEDNAEDSVDEKDSDSDDDDGGRTSIKDKPKKVVTEDFASSQGVKVKKSKKKKAKKGKKERIAEKKLEEANKNIDADKTPEDEVIAEKDDSNDTMQKKQKRRKPKIRSRQKNIKKDSRTSSQKPEHLKLGHKEYAGRPMTQETRSYLNLPESRAQRIRREREKMKETSTTAANSHHFDQGGLAIDDLLGETSTGLDVATSSELPETGELVGSSKKQQQITAKKKKKPKKKSKFKNLK